MRVIDIAAASSFALLSLALIVNLNPLDARRQTSSLVSDSRAAGMIRSYLDHHDLHFLAASSSSQLCESLSAWNTQGQILDITLEEASCFPKPVGSDYLGHAGFIFSLPTRNIRVDAWVR